MALSCGERAGARAARGQVARGTACRQYASARRPLVAARTRALIPPHLPSSVCVKVHASWGDFMAAFKREAGPKRLVAYTVYGSTYYGGERPGREGEKSHAS